MLDIICLLDIWEFPIVCLTFMKWRNLSILYTLIATLILPKLICL